MSSLIGIHSLSKAYGTQILFDSISFTISQGDRIGLLGPNGAGKSTLLKIILEEESPDEGYISKRKNLRVGYASQSPEFASHTLEEILAGKDENKLIKARILLSKAQFFDSSIAASTLSGGWKKRLDIVRALMDDPDILLLDEPTNHLDLEGIIWLEKFLAKEKTSYLIVSHDRYFLENISNQIIELNRCYPNGLFISKGNMSNFMEHREAFLLGQEQQEKVLASQVRDEVDWLKRSPKARTTKSRSRIQKAYELIDELKEVKQRNKKQTVDIDFVASERETRKLLTAKNLAKSLGDKSLFKGIDLILSPGTRLGIVGKNGTGKTTLLKILAGIIPQDMGTIKYADNLKLVYFDQHREKIPLNITLKQALSPVSDLVNYRGQSIHVNGWAKKFLFSQDRLELPVSCLSGGEKARILIAKLMLEPADILFLDEPTNDLDIPTLEVMEESLKEFSGAVVLISHDRCLMDRLCTQILSLGTGSDQQFFADYSQWEIAQSQNEQKKISKPKAQTQQQVVSPKSKKLSYKEQQELNGMEQNILNVEMNIANLQLQLEDPSIQNNSERLAEIYRTLAQEEEKLNSLFERWQILDGHQ